MASGLSLLGSSEEEGVGSRRSLHDELIESHASTTGSDNSGTGGLGELEGGNVELGAVKGSEIFSDGSNNNGGTSLVLSEASDHSGDRYRGSVNSGSNESSEDGLAEARVSSSGEESEELLGEMS